MDALTVDAPAASRFFCHNGFVDDYRWPLIISICSCAFACWNLVSSVISFRLSLEIYCMYALIYSCFTPASFEKLVV